MSRRVLALAQFRPLAGDCAGNARQMLDLARQARDRLRADAIIFPGLCLSGPAPGDLLWNRDFQRALEAALDSLRQLTGIALVFGLPQPAAAGWQNVIAVLSDGRILTQRPARSVPAADPRDLCRYFTAADAADVVSGGGEDMNGEIRVAGVSLGLLHGEELADPQAAVQFSSSVALLCVLDSTPYYAGQPAAREALAAQLVKTSGRPLVCVGQVGGQDDLVFAGGAFTLAADGSMAVRTPAWQSGLWALELDLEREVKQAGEAQRMRPLPGTVAPRPDGLAEIWSALVCGLCDYVGMNGFRGVLLGLSGGIDSALSLAIAVDALGPERVMAVMLPSRHTLPISREDAAAQAALLGVVCHELDIEPLFTTALDSLQGLFGRLEAAAGADTTRENLQARSRGLLLMAVANRTGHLLLTTSNKSELAVGYTTLYGDMAGGYSVLKDVPKTLVYRLAAYRNALQPAIPQRVLERPPSAELADAQLDSDALPPYPVLDDILWRYLEENQGLEEILAGGHDEAVVRDILERVDRSEFKRRQAAPGVRVSARDFARSWRCPLTSGLKH